MKSLDAIAAELQGYDPSALRADLVGDFLARLAHPVADTEEVAIFQALGRVLAQDLISPIHVPSHDNSAMDGYAFAGIELTGSPRVDLRVVGSARAGAAWRGNLRPGECIRIMTGAVMPGGLDTVVPQEMVQLTEGRASFSSGLLRPGDNRRLRGEDLQKNQAALLKGEQITPAALGLVASLGLEKITVRRRLRVAYFSTGDEVLSLGEPAREGAVYDSNRYTVFGLLSRLGCDMVDLGVVKDEPALLEAAFLSAAEQADAIITSGGVSVGEADHTKVIMKKLGDVAFWKIAMRPGRPMAVGRIQNALMFGLPGNPVAVMVTFLAFVRPALLQMMGQRPRPQPFLKARSLQALRKKPGRTEYQRGTVSTAADGTLEVQASLNQGSGVLSSMVQGNGLIVLHHEQGDVAVGELIDIMMFQGVI